MVTMYFPTAAKVQGTKKVAVCTTVSTLTAPKIATEIKAASSVEGTMVFRDFQPTFNTNTGNSPARLGTTTQLPQEGNTNLQPIPLAFPFDPSKPDSDPNNKMKALIVPGALLYVVVRRAVDIQTDWTVADLSDTWYGRIGFVDDEPKSSDDEFGEYEIHANFLPLQPKVKGALAA